MKVQLFHTVDCHAWKESLSVLEEALNEVQEEVRIEVILIENSDQAKRFKFLGSPTIYINEKDVDPGAEKATNFAVAACRPYFYKGKSYDYPPREMILKALN